MDNFGNYFSSFQKDNPNFLRSGHDQSRRSRAGYKRIDEGVPLEAAAAPGQTLVALEDLLDPGGCRLHLGLEFEGLVLGVGLMHQEDLLFVLQRLGQRLRQPGVAARLEFGRGQGREVLLGDGGDRQRVLDPLASGVNDGSQREVRASCVCSEQERERRVGVTSIVFAIYGCIVFLMRM